MMRMGLAALAGLMLAACGDSASLDVAGAAADGYTLEVRASDGAQAYIVTAPDGRIAAAQAADGVSALMAPDRAQTLAAAPAQVEDAPEVLALRLPGFQMNIAADDAEGDERARVMIAVGNGPRIEINARDGAGGEDRAHVRISGASAESAREFINEAEELSDEVKAAMRAELGL